MVGYSGTPLPQKLGIKEGHRIALVSAPEGFEDVLGVLPTGAMLGTEQTIRDVALPTGLVDNKVCAIDETWSGLRLVIRKEHRTT
jgi:hypothetical protein